MTAPTPSENDAPPGRSTRRILIAAMLAIIVAGVVFAVWQWMPRTKLPAGITSDEFAAAKQQFRETYRREPSHTGTLSLLAEVALAEEDLPKAVTCFRAIPTDDPDYGLSARLQEGQVFIRMNRAAEAERSLRDFLAAGSADARVPRSHLVTARKWLDYLYSVELRFEDRKAVLAELHRSGQADVFDSKQYYFPTLLLWHSTTGRYRLAEFLEQDPDNPYLLVAHGRYLTTEGRLDEARAVLDEQHRKFPNDRACMAALLECLFEQADHESFAVVARELPPYDDEEPWLLTRMRGQFALDERRWRDAASWFEKTLAHDPADPVCHMGLARALGGLGDASGRAAIQERSTVLAEIRVSLVGVTQEAPDASRRLADACETIGLPDAARTFRNHAARMEGADRVPGSTAVPL